MFELAIKKMEEAGLLISQPESFLAYAKSQGVDKPRTAEFISVQTLKSLNPLLREKGYMVLRLGSPSGERHTNFALAKMSKPEDFFLIDEQIFGDAQMNVFLPSASVRSLFAFQLLPELTETSLVNLALASGLLTKALGLEVDQVQMIPATGQSTFNFDFRPLAAQDVVLSHQKGQVEIDAVFVGQRDGKECLFVLEAKSGKKGFDSLAKYKLLYPVLALKQKVPDYMDIVPVYMRTVRANGAIEFSIAECTYHDGIALDEMQVKSVSRFSLHGY